jgi:hypothetical protein
VDAMEEAWKKKNGHYKPPATTLAAYANKA